MFLRVVIFFFTMLTAIASEAQQVNYFVSSSGSDGNSGLSSSTPFATIQHAANLVMPGDTVFVMNGTYSNAQPDGNVLTIGRSGAKDSVIVFINFPGHHPLLRFNGWHGILVEGASYIHIEGFHIQGNNDSITFIYAQDESWNTENPLTSGHGIGITYNATDSVYSENISIHQNIIWDCGGYGIYNLHGDWIWITENEVFDCCKYSPMSTSAIAQLRPRNSDDDPRYKLRIERNLIYGNKNLIADVNVGEIIGGHAIYINNSFPSEMTLCPYNGRTVVSNNIVYDNGAAALYVTGTYLVFVIHNTFAQNSAHPDVHYGEVFLRQNYFVYLRNNIFVFGSNPYVVQSIDNYNCEGDYNFYDLTATNQLTGVNDVNGSDPLFQNFSMDPAVADFSLQPLSPAIDEGFQDSIVFDDFFGKIRPIGISNDIGAIEYDPFAGFENMPHNISDCIVEHHSQQINIISENIIYSAVLVHLSGKIVNFQTPVAHSVLFNTSSLPAGLYCVMLQTSQGHRSIKIVL